MKQKKQKKRKKTLSARLQWQVDLLYRIFHQSNPIQGEQTYKNKI